MLALLPGGRVTIYCLARSTSTRSGGSVRGDAPAGKDPRLGRGHAPLERLLPSKAIALSCPVR